MPRSPKAPEYRFDVALSFPGERRATVRRVAAELAKSLPKERILYDEWYKAEFAKPNLAPTLQKLYHKESRLLVYFFCKEYEKEWCGLEWRAGQDLLKKKQDDRLMLFRWDGTEVDGVFSIDGYLDIRKMTAKEIGLNRAGISGGSNN